MDVRASPRDSDSRSAYSLIELLSFKQFKVCMCHVLLRPGRSFTRIKGIESRCRDPGVGPMHLVLIDEGRERQCTAGSALYIHINKEGPELRNCSLCSLTIYRVVSGTHFDLEVKFWP